ncbi:MAG: STAS domain-containing protein [Gaiellaceae bacterium]
MKADFALTPTRASARVYVLEVVGELDLYTAPRLSSQVGELIALGAAGLVVDLTETTFIDSTALHVLLDAKKRVHAVGGELVVVCPSPHVRRIFEITGVDGLLRLFGSLEAALEALSPQGAHAA